MTPSWPAWGKSAARFAIGAFITAAIVVVLAMPSEPAAWSVVALVVVLGTTTGQSVTAATNRMIGSVVGCITGAVVQVALPWLWLPLRVCIAVFACMLVCRLLRVGAGQRLGMALAAFFVFVPGDQEWQTVGWRLLATLIGIVIALLISLALWPASARDKLATGINAALTSISAQLEQVRTRLHGGTATPLTLAPIAPLRSLVSERRYEPTFRGPDAATLSGVLDGLELSAAGLGRLDAACVAGPEGLLRVMAPDLDAVIDDLQASCDSMRAHLAARPRRRVPHAFGSGSVPNQDQSAPNGVDSTDLDNVDARLSLALERLRAAHVTPAADARELRDLFGTIDALSLIAQGLRAAQTALARS